MKTFRRPILLGIILSTILALGLSGCKCAHQDKKVGNDLDLETSTDSFPYPGIVFLLPSPSEVLLITFNNDIAFDENLVAPIDLDKKAIISQQQALILGVYITDLSYNIIYKNYQAGIKNINSIQALSRNLGIASLLNDRYFNRIESNINNIDSMDAVFNDFTQNSFGTLETTGNYELLSLVAMGSGLEAMYLSYKSVNLKTINNTIIPELLGQKVIFENYYKNFLNFNYNKQELESLIVDIKSIYSLFERNVAVRNYSTVQKIKDSQFAIKDRTISAFNEKSIRELGDSIIIVRNNLINLKYQ